MARRVGLLAGVVGLALVSAWVALTASRGALPPSSVVAEGAKEPTALPASSVGATGTDEPGADDGFSFSAPSGQPATLTCLEARRILRQIKTSLAYPPPAITPSALAVATADWLDPHGLWSASPDSPIPAVLERQAQDLLRELSAPDAAPCIAARGVGAALVRWTGELAARFDESRRRAASGVAAPKADAVRTAAEEALFDDEGHRARELATTLGDHGGALERGMGAAITPYVDAARTRFFPPLDVEGWAGVVRAAAIRAYVQVVDPHGAWAPSDEEASVYDVDLEPHPPDRLWDDGLRTAVGVRVGSGPMDPLEVGDVVLSIAGVATVGLPLEQLDQLVYATTDAPASASLVVLRRDEREPRTLELPVPETGPDGEDAAADLPSYRVPYATGDALVVEIHDVRRDLGDELARTLRKETAAGARPVDGLLLDLRDDGGGSTEGAIAAIALFLPGAPLFPMARRDGSIEVDRAPEPAAADIWTRPVAALVDGDTASAAEMIAGALMAYRRGPVVGERTYGKGCAQEYMDDDAHAGVLRLTTLLYALPDGTPVQGVGLEPSLLLPALPPADGTDAPGPFSSPSPGSHQREADEPNAPPTWRGPDVRDPTRVLSPSAGTWPEHRGTVGPCRDSATEETVCRALRALGAASPARRPTAALTAGPTGTSHR